MNSVILIGNLAADPRIATLTTSQKPVANLRLITSEKSKDRNGQKKEYVEGHNVVMFGRLAEIAEEFLKKGSQVQIEGKLVNRQFEQEGTTKYTTEVHVSSMKMLGGTMKKGDNLPTSTN